jgi:hypothetical protein
MKTQFVVKAEVTEAYGWIDAEAMEAPENEVLGRVCRDVDRQKCGELRAFCVTLIDAR